MASSKWRKQRNSRKQRQHSASPRRRVDATSEYELQRQQSGRRVVAVDATSAWRRCVEVASRQLGLITWGQLSRCGIPPCTINRRIKAGVLQRLHARVYVLGHRALAPMARELAAQLACGDRAVIAGRSAAFLWGLSSHPPPRVEVTMVGQLCRSKSGIRLRRTTRLDPCDIRAQGPLRLTSPARTIIDLAAEVPVAELERLIAEARSRRLLRDGQLEAALGRAGTRPGSAAVRAYLGREGGPVLTRSDKERLLRALVRRAGLPQPLSNVKLGRWEADFLWATERVIVEVDSWGFHGTRAAFERDRRKDRELQAMGYYVIRVTANQLRQEPLAVIAQIARALGGRARPSPAGAPG